MARRLHKKLEKLESDLTKLINEDPMENEAAARYRQRFIFLKNLLSAEKESDPANPNHLRHIEQWLSLLEDAFLDWISSPSPSPAHHHLLHACSCTHACRSEQQDGPSSDTASQVDDYVLDADPEPAFFGQDSEDPEPVSGQESKETPPGLDLEEKPSTTAPPSVFVVVEEESRRENGSAWAVIVVAMFSVAAWMIMAAVFSGRSVYYKEYFGLPPT